ncbi:PPC domain-containing DNA-binding protein [Allosphingosinicella sp.]|uniref:PPC domain-containing DNA-binding protein n=1 Tax=Allosphingosinicella sp. TaxID=2823234 RepID=UPI002FC10917
MHSKIIHNTSGLRTIAAIFEAGDEVMSGLRELSRREKIRGAQITGIGAFSDALLAYFDWDEKDYREIPVDDQVEVASLTGDIGVNPDNSPAIHIHIVLGRRDGSAVAGHLVKAHVRPTLELILTDSPEHLCRRKDPESGLNLIQL